MQRKSKQLIADTRIPLPPAPGKISVQDYEYKRNGTRNIFVATEPKGGKRHTKVTKQRKKEDYASFIVDLVKQYSDADCIRIVQDNLNTHTEKSLIHTFGKRKARHIMKRIECHFMWNACFFCEKV